MRARIPEIIPPRAAGSPRRRKRPADQPRKKGDYLWGDFWDDPAVRKARRRIVAKAWRRLAGPGSEERDALLESLRTGDDSFIENLINDDDSSQLNFWWEELSVNLYSDLHSELSATVEVPTPTRAQRKKTLASVAKLRREQLPNYEEAAAALERGAGVPARQKEMADRRRLSRWAKRLTGSYCDAEVAVFLTAARRHCGYRNARVSPAALKQDRRRNPRQYSLKP